MRGITSEETQSILTINDPEKPTVVMKLNQWSKQAEYNFLGQNVEYINSVIRLNLFVIYLISIKA